MHFLVPLAFGWLGSVGVLVWLWRYATSRHQIRVSSLVPFEHLMRRQPSHRRRVVVNWLFWLQCACLVLIAMSLAQPMWLARSTKTLLLVLDTSASMSAHEGLGRTPFARARQHLLSRLNGLGSGERVVLVTTAPVRALTPEPTTDRFTVQQLLRTTHAADLGGRLSSAAGLGAAVLGATPDEMVIATDEPVPSSLPPSVHLLSSGEAVPNVAIVGVEAYEPLCLPPLDAQLPDSSVDTSHLAIVLHNFSAQAQEVEVHAKQHGRLLAQQRRPLGANERGEVVLTLESPSSDAPIELHVRAPHDALAADNQAWVMLHGRQSVSVAVASDRPEFVEAIGRWLDACPGMTWRSTPLPPHSNTSDELLVTDQMSQALAWPGAALVYAQAERTTPSLAHWLPARPDGYGVAGSHIVTTYLRPLEPVATAIADTPSSGGEPVLWALRNGQRVPLVRVQIDQGRRLVSCAFDPTAMPSSVPAIVLFFNSVRWLVTSQMVGSTGEPLIVGPLPPGAVRVERPDGVVERLAHGGGMVRYDATDHAGVYRLSQGDTVEARAVNMIDSLESNMQQRTSTWATPPAGRGISSPAGIVPARSAALREAASPMHRLPLAPWLIGVIVALLLIEWRLYVRRGRV